MSTANLGYVSQQFKDKRKDKLGKNEDVAKGTKEKDDREARINYTLDMVVHDLVGQGHLHPAKSYLLKTPEMKQHIGRMCDQLNRRKKEELVNKRTNIVPKSFSTSSKPLDVSSSIFNNVPNMTRGFALMKNTEQDNTHENEERKQLPSSRSVNILPGKSHSLSHREMASGIKKLEPWVSPRDITDKRPRRHAVSKTENGTAALKQKKIRKQLDATEGPAVASASQGNSVNVQAYRAKINMSGFTNDEISLDLDDRKLVITAQRAKKGSQNSRKVTEIIEIPKGVDLENLKIGRRLDGCLLIEEFVPGIDNS